MDGNGRWAKQRNLPRIAGHRKGVEVLDTLLPHCVDRGIECLTLFAFSSENWNRPPTEVRLLMELLHSTIDAQMQRMHENNVRLRIVGELASFSDKLQTKIRQAENLTHKNDGLNVTIAMNYGGRWDICQAARRVAIAVQAGELLADEINETVFDTFMTTSGIPEPDLFIRTGGETRISNFLLWQLAYTEMVFTNAYWPDFDETELDKAIQAFVSRQRRFGKTGEQIEASL